MSDHRKSAKLWMERGSGMYLAGMSDYKDALKAKIRKRIDELKGKTDQFRTYHLYAAEELQKLLRSLDTIDPL